jgi:hypothetical protein
LLFSQGVSGYEPLRRNRRPRLGEHRGDIVHQGEAHPGQHEAILDPELWQIVQNKLAVHRQERALAVGAEAPSLLAGLIVDADGHCGAIEGRGTRKLPSSTCTSTPAGRQSLAR